MADDAKRFGKYVWVRPTLGSDELTLTIMSQDEYESVRFPMHMVDSLSESIEQALAYARRQADGG